ncbi:M20/M25/M40 family metallo-hydrolase [Novosphingobium taihuense]|uniref:Acetylornithine deacetylase/succinyl-diaminopimelate desuccinylase-like protein n=1 Tax=Novosphingobium taihuense TaxID=260085 RepID=A0A7W7ETM4_9SPHN|nr:M20/M25/M40 family metallo-hydrolase [Novosphingobium taihuense]MBB4613533.1 acetylornithine deacetylase/succinyl-diaminopimelate desuccinylase-like protein [Novosphingobium taihuense]TWH81223.1 acetylornithine deacetylase/succinyl-diaminopimelate desuccinylase-like protein [Novosphingobium taihuense]
MATKFRIALAATVALSMPAAAKEAAYPKAEAQVLDLAQKAISIRSVRGDGNKTIDVAKLFADALVAGGWSASDIEITPVDDTAYLIATWKGANPALKPLVISGHMDVVEAKREDWERDPFVPVVENGILYGRGASDMKFDGALALSTLIELRRQGYKPKRTIVIEFSGDEETTMKTSAIIAEKLKNAELVINVDGGGGALDEATGKPLYWTWQGAEKTYADYRLEVTNPGGHSSAPRPDNAIIQLSQALVKVGAYKFKAEQNEITKGYFDKAAAFTDRPEIAAAMRAFAANPADDKALATLRADPSMVGKVGTTCVPTMLGGGHAENALPQRAFANINCRIFPGHSKEDIMAELAGVIGDPSVKISDVTAGSVATPASPVRPDVVAAVSKAMNKAYPGVPLIPSQASGASDSMWFRALGISSYGLSPSFSKDSEDFSHGLNERTRLSNIRPGITYYLSLITDLTK